MLGLFFILQLSAGSPPGWFAPVVHSEGQSVVLDVVCDSTGFIRTATQDGLHRFDGREWITTRRTATDSLSFSDNWINRILEWRKGIFYLATESGGLNVYDEFTGDKKALPADSASGLKTGTIRDMSLMPDESILLATWGQGLFSYQPATGKYRSVTVQNQSEGLTDPFVRQLSADGNGTWIATRNGLNYLTNLGTIQSWMPSRIISEKDVDFIVCAEPDGDTGAWFGTRNGVYHLNKTTNQIRSFGPAGWKPIITTLFRDGEGNLWVGTYNDGVVVLDGEGTIRFRFNTTNQMLPGNYIRRITLDSDGNAWIGTWGFGLTFLRRNPDVFSVLPGTDGLPVRSAMEVNGTGIFTGTWGNGLLITTPIGVVSSEQLKDITSITGDGKGTLWAGGSQGLLELTEKVGQIRWWREKSGQELLPGAVRKLWYQSNGNLWVLTNGGILVENRKTGMLHFLSESGLLPDKNTETMVTESDTSAWFAFRNKGIARVSWRSDSTGLPLITRVTPYRSDPGNLNSLSGNSVLHLFIDPANRLWVATATGLNLFLPETSTFKRFGLRDGFPNEVMYAITTSTDGFYWVSSNAGLTRFRLDDENEISSIRTWNHLDGLVADEFNTSAVINFSDGRLGFGSIKGLIVFNPADLNKDPQPPSLGLSGVSVGVNPVTYTPGQPLIMNYLDQIVEIRYAVLRFDNPDRHRFTWFLDGFDDQWSVPQPDGKVVYTNLDPGTYTLKLRGADAGGSWSDQSLEIPLVVVPPFYMTWWFRGGILLLILGIPVVYVTNRFEKMRAMEQLRVKIARDLHDEVGAQLTRVNIQANLLASQIQPDQREVQARTLIDESQAVIRTMSDVVWSIDAGNDSVGEWMNRVRSFAETLCEPAGIRLTFHAEGFNPQKPMNIQFRQDLYLIVKEAVNNAVKYSGGTDLDLRFIKSGSGWELTVKDNGKGMPATPPRGNGLKNIRSRVQAIGADVEWISDSGTTVKISGSKFP